MWYFSPVFFLLESHNPNLILRNTSGKSPERQSAHYVTGTPQTVEVQTQVSPRHGHRAPLELQENIQDSLKCGVLGGRDPGTEKEHEVKAKK